MQIYAIRPFEEVVLNLGGVIRKVIRIAQLSLIKRPSNES